MIPKLPLDIGRVYAGFLSRYIVPIAKAAHSILTPDRIAALLRVSPNVRFDATGDDVDTIIQLIRLKALGQRPTDSDQITAISRAGNATSTRARVNVDRALRKSGVIQEPMHIRAHRETLNTFVSENVRLIGGMEDAQYRRLDRMMRRAVNEGWTQERLTKNLQRYIGEDGERLGAARAQLIARDQVLKLHAKVTREQYENEGVTEYKWHTMRDDRVRDSHRANEGKIFSWDDPPITGHPGEDYQCRCYAVPVIPKKGKYLDRLSQRLASGMSRI